MWLGPVPWTQPQRSLPLCFGVELGGERVEAVVPGRNEQLAVDDRGGRHQASADDVSAVPQPGARGGVERVLRVSAAVTVVDDAVGHGWRRDAVAVGAYHPLPG